eukprot:6156255-Pleurochrysis_carterae.AAC.1
MHAFATEKLKRFESLMYAYAFIYPHVEQQPAERSRPVQQLAESNKRYSHDGSSSCIGCIIDVDPFCPMNLYNSTALGYSAYFTGAHVHSLYTTHAFVWRVAGSHGQGAGAGAGAKRTYGAAQGRGRSAGKGGHRERVSKSLRSGARALRKYACDASPIWETVHVSVRSQMKGARDYSLQVAGIGRALQSKW